MYRVVCERFRDLTDNHIYKKDDIFPCDGREIDENRIKELSTKKNKIGKVLIAKIEETN